MKIIIGSDHTGFELKNNLIKYFEKKGVLIDDNGNIFNESDDYPDIALELCNKVVSGEYDRGIVICGSGVGIGIAANKVNGIRCGTCNEEYLVKMARKDNDINVLAIGSRIIDLEKAKKIIDIFIQTEFLGERHQRRVDKISKIEQMMKEGK